jgi:hypothetical protein
VTQAEILGAVGAGALALVGLVMLILSRTGRRLSLPGVGRLSVITHALVGVCCLAAAHQVAAHAFGMDPRLPPLVVGAVFLFVIIGSIALDAAEGPGSDA